MFIKQDTKENGFMALTAVLFFSAFFVVLLVGMFFSSAESAERTLDRERSLVALSLANSCAEIAINALWKDAEYPGDVTLSIDEEKSCEIYQIEKYGRDGRVVKAKADVGGQHKNIQIEIDIESWPELRIVDWREVADFSEFEEE
jgi:hypothetical protein